MSEFARAHVESVLASTQPMRDKIIAVCFVESGIELVKQSPNRDDELLAAIDEFLKGELWSEGWGVG